MVMVLVTRVYADIPYVNSTQSQIRFATRATSAPTFNI